MAIVEPFANGLDSAFPATQSDAIARIPRTIAFRYDALALAFEAGSLRVALADPSDPATLDALRSTTRLKIEPVGLPRAEIRTRLRAAYGAVASEHTDAPSVRIVDALFSRAIAAHASDIHVEPSEGGGHIRVRVDGILRELDTVDAELFPAVVSRIKILAGMDVADKRQAQDGRYAIAAEHRRIDARIASIPTIDGEKLVVRLLDRHAQAPQLHALGLSPQIAAEYGDAIRAPWGFVVVTGPTGSGKTTTLYASLGELDRLARNVCSVEDPVEMRIPRVTQVQTSARGGITFAGALRSFMRQDPNVIMVGEMRDAETAGVAVSAALAGQLVLTTLHANDAPRTVERLIELGVSRHALAAGLTAILAQRLVRRLCDRCRSLAPIPAAIRHGLSLPDAPWFVPGSCNACAGTGYVGRTGVYEFIALSDEMRSAIAAGCSSVELGRIATTAGYRPMIDDGIAKVLAGETSFAEIERVVRWIGAR